MMYDNQMLQSIVPSKFVRDYYNNIDYKWVDLDLATMIWNGSFDYLKKLQLLQELAENTEDVELRRQINERLVCEHKKRELFENNDHDDYVYVVFNQGDFLCGLFTKYATALSYAKKKAIEDQETYSIHKQWVVKGEDLPFVKSSIKINKNILEDHEPKEVIYDGDPVSLVTLNKDGVIYRYWSNELKDEEDIDEFAKHRFEQRFLTVPLPECFDQGVPVKYLPTGKYGIVHTSRKEWDLFIRKINEGLYVDYSDYSVKVLFLTKEGYFSHSHISPMELEIEVPVENPLLYRAFEALNDWWHGIGNEHIVIETSINYANSFKRIPKSLDDIIF